MSGIVAGIMGGSPTIVTCVEDERLEFQVCSSLVIVAKLGPAAWAPGVELLCASAGLHVCVPAGASLCNLGMHFRPN